ncbi:hypothetical protein JKF63_07539 [Porcisia hertigi]|uniref:Uncharacterized protein n=1 Tax=Porcisia hertigi TaxID=2761500 RepID=A0A836ID28_9TRYP|nr:hypothetical protein JKF63_07539 [Porcisia hertigi]
MFRLTSESQKQKGSAALECNRLLFGLALLFTIISDGALDNQFTALSTTITANCDPSALQQLATFAAMEDVAEEEHLDWGSTSRLVQEWSTSLTKPRNARSPGSTSLSRGSPDRHHGTDMSSVLSSGLSNALGDTPTDETAGDSSAGSSSSSFRRRRPHRRHHRRMGAVSDTVSDESSCGELTVKPSASPPVDRYLMWTQLDVMQMALSTGDSSFVDMTKHLLEQQKMFPTIYRCDLNKVDCPYEADLLAAPTVGLASSSWWKCEGCGKRHDVVRESCLRCRTSGPYAKLFIGQAVKEVDCTASLVRFFYATHPDIMIHRAECHHDPDVGVSVRGKGCASVYVRRDDAAVLQEKLHHNAFFDVDSVTGEIFVYYVYAEQQAWLRSLAQQRNAAVEQRLLFLPLAPLVVEDSASPSPPARRHTGHGRRHKRAGDPSTTTAP